MVTLASRMFGGTPTLLCMLLSTNLAAFMGFQGLGDAQDYHC